MHDAWIPTFLFGCMSEYKRKMEKDTAIQMQKKVAKILKQNNALCLFLSQEVVYGKDFT